jgi:hypothetical protein
MSELDGHDQSRLFRLDEDLHAEADRILAGSGLGEIIRAEGFEPQGSYVMRTMTWRDLDFERHQDPPDWASHWTLGSRLAGTGWPWRASCINAYREPSSREQGVYWGLRVFDPSEGPEAPVWKIDLWTARAEEFARQCPHRGRWQALMTDDRRYHILKLKEAVCHLPEYRKTMLSVHVYEAVLDCGIRTVEEFMRWWESRREQGC